MSEAGTFPGTPDSLDRRIYPACKGPYMLRAAASLLLHPRLAPTFHDLPPPKAEAATTNNTNYRRLLPPSCKRRVRHMTRAQPLCQDHPQRKNQDRAPRIRVSLTKPHTHTRAHAPGYLGEQEVFAFPRVPCLKLRRVWDEILLISHRVLAGSCSMEAGGFVLPP